MLRDKLISVWLCELSKVREAISHTEDRQNKIKEEIYEYKRKEGIIGEEYSPVIENLKQQNKFEEEVKRLMDQNEKAIEGTLNYLRTKPPN